LLREKTLSPEFLVAFLNSSYGKFQSIREATGNVQLNLFIEKIKDFTVPKYNNPGIAKLVRGGLQKLNDSKTLYFQAENLLLEELGLKEFEPEDELSYTVNLSDVKSAHRADAAYFQPKYKKLINKFNLQKGKLSDLVTLGEVFSIRRGDFINTEYYVEKSMQAYIRIKELPSKGDINLDVVTYIDDNFSSQNTETLLEGDFVFAGIGATLGKTARIPREMKGAFYSNNTVRFRVKNNWKARTNTHYLQVLLQSLACQAQFEQRQAQTAQAKIADQELRAVLIPILPKPTQQEIADLVIKSHEFLKKSKNLLEKAKREVERFIREYRIKEK